MIHNLFEFSLYNSAKFEMSNFLEAEFDSEEDEDYNPTAKEEAEADAVLKQLESGPIE